VPEVDVALTVFGGAVSEMEPTVLPEGASAGNQDCDFAPGAVFTRAGTLNVASLSPAPITPSNFNWVKTYEQDDGEIDTLALDNSGVLWQEDVVNSPGIFSPIFSAIEPGSTASSVTFDDVEYIALSNGVNATDIPRQWNGQWLDRVSQVGPGAPPQISASSAGSAITNIVQNPPVSIPISTGGTSGSILLFSNAPIPVGVQNLPHTAGNVMSWYFPKAYVLPAYIQVGSNIVVTGVQTTTNGFNPNSGAMNGAVANPPYYTITSMPGLPSATDNDYYIGFTVIVPFSDYYSGRFISGSEFQATIATLTAAVQVPFLEVGNQFTVEGNSQDGYNETWTVATTPNASQLSITNSSRTGGIASYNFILISGTTPVAGQFVTMVGLLNGNGAFDVVNAVINTVIGSVITILFPGADIAGASEDGNGIISGTIFTFDTAGVAVPPIIGTGLGGTIATSGVLGVGIRKCVCIFKTRNGALTAPSPFIQFNITVADNAMVISQIPIGPPNVIARILAFTGAGGANYFWIPEPVTVTSNGQQITYSSTIVNDNTSSQVTLSFPDAVLLSADAIDIEGNNLFNQIELGACTGFVSYADRLIAWGEQNKIQNLLNLSFDGGIGVNTAAQPNFALGAAPVTSFPLGWTIDPTYGGGGSLQLSPIFGNCYQIDNHSGSTQATLGDIFQPAFQDEYQVPIVQSGTAYSCRVTASCTPTASGNLVVQFFSPQLNQVFGTFSIPLANMTTSMKVFTGTLLTTPFGAVPNDLILDVYAENILDGTTIQIDRIEPFPTRQPVFSTQFRASYTNNPEAFDLITGAFGPSQNQQPVRGALVLFDTLYMLKGKSWYSTSDNGVTEPDHWTWREVSNKVGTSGIHSFDYGEGWALSADRSGINFFNGGEPIKISQENQPVWEMINWDAGQQIWLKNDVTNKRIFCGVPISTPNQYMPEFPLNENPTSPNVILMVNYRELNTGMALADTGPIRSSFQGRLLAPEPARKTSFWNVKSPYADFVDRGDNNAPLFICSGYEDSKIFKLNPTQLFDDGEKAINSYYITSGLMKPDDAQAKQLPITRMLISYLRSLVTGYGNVNIWIYPNTPFNPLPQVLQPIALDAITTGDLESMPNQTGERFFVRYGTNAAGAAFRLSKVVARLAADPWASVRGTAKQAL
jgi:hypothetical protein